MKGEETRRRVSGGESWNIEGWRVKRAGGVMGILGHGSLQLLRSCTLY